MRIVELCNERGLNVNPGSAGSAEPRGLIGSPGAPDGIPV